MKAARLAAAVAVAMAGMAPGRTGVVAPATRPVCRKPLQGLRRVRLVAAGVGEPYAAATRTATAKLLRKSLPELALDGPADGWTLKVTWPAEPAGAPWRRGALPWGQPVPRMTRVRVSKHMVVDGYEGEFVMYEQARPALTPVRYTRGGKPIYPNLQAHDLAFFVEAWRKANPGPARMGEPARQGRAAPRTNP